MKSAISRKVLLAAACIPVISALMPTGVRAATVYWDADGNVANNAPDTTPPTSNSGNGIWSLDPLNTVWYDSLNGLDRGWINGDSAYFGANAGNIIGLGSDLTVGSLTFANNTLKSDTVGVQRVLTLTGNINAGGSAIIGDAANPNDLVINLTAGGHSFREFGTGNANSAGVYYAKVTGAGSLNIQNGASVRNDTNDFTGGVSFGIRGGSFTSVNDYGVASSLGAAASGTIVYNTASSFGTVSYIGTGSTTNRAFSMANTFVNNGTGTLTFNGSFNMGGTIQANGGDIVFNGVVSGGAIAFQGAKNIYLNNVANTFTGNFDTYGNVFIKKLSNAGVASSAGAGPATALIQLVGGTLSYTGTGDSTNRRFAVYGSGKFRNDGTGAVAFTNTGAIATQAANTTVTLGGSYVGAANSLAAQIADPSITTRTSVIIDGAGIWRLDNAGNTYSGTTTVSSGVLRAGAVNAFGNGTSDATVASGAALDLNDFSAGLGSLSGAGLVTLGSNAATRLTLGDTSGSTTWSGSITGAGGVTKTGNSTVTFAAAQGYTGPTAVIGTLRLDFSAAGAPAINIINPASGLDLTGGVVELVGAAATGNSQAFSILRIQGGQNSVTSAPGSGGGTLTTTFSDIVRTSGTVDFSSTGSYFTSTTTVIGPWATIGLTNFATVDTSTGRIVPLTVYFSGYDLATWNPAAANQYVSDDNAGTPAAYVNALTGDVSVNAVRFNSGLPSTNVTPTETREILNLGGFTLCTDWVHR